MRNLQSENDQEIALSHSFLPWLICILMAIGVINSDSGHVVIVRACPVMAEVMISGQRKLLKERRGSCSGVHNVACQF